MIEAVEGRSYFTATLLRASAPGIQSSADAVDRVYQEDVLQNAMLQDASTLAYLTCRLSACPIPHLSTCGAILTTSLLQN